MARRITRRTTDNGTLPAIRLGRSVRVPVTSVQHLSGTPTNLDNTRNGAHDHNR